MKTIHKYSLQPVLDDEDNDILVTSHVIQFIHAAMQHGELCMWATVDTEKPAEKHRFRLVVTGGEVPESFIGFYGTVLMYGGNLVLHVFEVPV